MDTQWSTSSTHFIPPEQNKRIKRIEIVWHIEINWYLVCMWDDVLRNLFIETNSRFYCCEPLPARSLHVCVSICIVRAAYTPSWVEWAKKRQSMCLLFIFPVSRIKSNSTVHPWHCGWILWSLIDVLTESIYPRWWINIARGFRMQPSSIPSIPFTLAHNTHASTHKERISLIYRVWEIEESSSLFFSRIFRLFWAARVSLPFMCDSCAFRPFHFICILPQ